MNRNDLELTRDQQLIQSAWPDWLLQEEIGRGQYGIVYRAVRHGLAGDSHSAIKIVEIGLDPGECTYSPDQVEAYLESSARKYAREIQVMESVKGYSNIVSIEDYHICRNTGSNPWYVLIRMELLVSLYEYLENREITGELVTRLGSDLSSALEVCAAKQIAHRDIKPANVFVNSEGIFKLGDFGVSRQIMGSTSRTKTGTPDYMAPEVYNGSLHTAGFEEAAKADIYSLGMLLYWLANGRRLPFIARTGLVSSDERTEAFEKRMRGEAFPPPSGVPEAIQAVIIKACSYAPEDRYESARAFREALAFRDTPRVSGTRRFLPALACVLVLAAGVLCWVLIGNRPAVDSGGQSGISQPAQEYSWPVLDWSGTETALRFSESGSGRIRALLGPGSPEEYVTSGSFGQADVLSASAVLQENGYVLVDLETKESGRRCVYIEASVLTEVPEETAPPAACTVSPDRDVQLSLGPGKSYVSDPSLAVPAGTEFTVFFEVNGWVLSEFDSGAGKIRAWLPADSLKTAP